MLNALLVMCCIFGFAYWFSTGLWFILELIVGMIKMIFSRKDE